MRREISLYIAILGLFAVGAFAVLRLGRSLEPGAPSTPAAASSSASAPFREPLAVLLLQMITVIGVARLSGSAFGRIGQPRVVGEIVAGILLGPSLLGLLAPGAFGLLFPASSLRALRLLSELGVVLFMFVVGLELDLDQLRHRARTAVVVSHASIVVPYFLGLLLALALYRSAAPPGVPFLPFGLFIGIALSITAFPVLARILQERGIAKTSLGSTAITCAAVDDVTAWCILAAVVAVAGSHALGGALITVALVGSFTFAMLRLVRPALGRLLSRSPFGGAGAPSIAVLVLFASALATELLGIHALFGAFLAGCIMPRTAEVQGPMREGLERFSSVVLLPLFFAFTGLRTELSLLRDPSDWLLCLVVVLVATVGKIGGSALAARWTGMSWNESFSLGALMNTRGLMELVALHIGYDLGILTPKLFTVFVLMALATTLLTGPLLTVIRKLDSRRAPDPRSVSPAASES